LNLDANFLVSVIMVSDSTRWDLWVFILEVWSGCDFVWTGDEFVKRENAILIGNHSGGLDFVPGIVVTSRAGVGCGHMMTLMKKSLQYMPTIGTLHSHLMYCFLAKRHLFHQICW
jgi:1-acyl-sn-glycerol-3-phosphate acyltransferase